jgi:N6-adenosine-specific RNA methylase IME4
MSELPRVLVADAPWRFSDRLPGKTRGAESQYACLSVDDIKRFPLPELAQDALLFFWRVSAMQQEALDVIAAWGFELKSELVWIKTTTSGGRAFGMGRYVRHCHETCLIARRGSGKVRSRSVRSVFDAPIGRHSEKPERFYELVEELADGPYVEMFARRRRDGWTCLGNELPEAT